MLLLVLYTRLLPYTASLDIVYINRVYYNCLAIGTNKLSPFNRNRYALGVTTADILSIVVVSR